MDRRKRIGKICELGERSEATKIGRKEKEV